MPSIPFLLVIVVGSLVIMFWFSRRTARGRHDQYAQSIRQVAYPFMVDRDSNTSLHVIFHVYEATPSYPFSAEPLFERASQSVCMSSCMTTSWAPGLV